MKINVLSTRRYLSAVLAGMSVMFATMSSSHAQLSIEIQGTGGTQYPISIMDFASSRAQGGEISSIIRADLGNSGMFKLIDHQQTVLSDSSPVEFALWNGLGANHIAVGSTNINEKNQLITRYRLLDTIQANQVDGAEILVPGGDTRRAAHQVADRIYEKITGVRGVFSTRIAYVIKKGDTFELQVADADGFNPRTALRSREPIISPSWSPDGSKLAYVSFELRKPVVYVHTLATGKRIQAANFKGNNSAPAWSPNGQQLAVVLSRDGGSQLFLINADGSGEPKRITSSNGIDTEPVFSPDGKSIYFTSDRGGNPQIYRINLGDNMVQRVTYEGSYNTSATVSPDGRLLAYVSRQGGNYRIAVLDMLNNSPALIVSDGSSDLAPSFAPNSRQILFASDKGGRGVLATVSSDGRTKQVISSVSGDIRQPKWGPFLP